MDRGPLIGKEVVIGGWDYTREQLPAWVEGVVAERRSADTYLVSLKRPIAVTGMPEARLVVTGRHLGHPVHSIVVGPLKMLLCRHRLLARLFAPLVGVNVETEGGDYFAVALIYLRSLFVSAGGKLPEDGPAAESNHPPTAQRP